MVVLPRTQPFGAALEEQLGDALSAPFEILGSVTGYGAGQRAGANALGEIRRAVAAAGGDVAAIWPYSAGLPPQVERSGYAVRLLPAMPDAGARCRDLSAHDSTRARIVACREAARISPGEVRPLIALAESYLNAFSDLTDGQQQDPRNGTIWYGAEAAMVRAARLDPAAAGPAPYLPTLVELFKGDSLRALERIYQHFATGQAREAALATATEIIRFAPDSIVGYADAVNILVASRPGQALQFAARFIRRKPERVEGWVEAGVAAWYLGDAAASLRFFNRAIALDRRYFTRLSWGSTYGAGEYYGARKHGGVQPPATLADLPQQ